MAYPHSHIPRPLQYFSSRIRYSVLLIGILLLGTGVWAQPANDNCANAGIINVPAAGFRIGTFTSSVNEITNATVESGEVFAPAIMSAGLDRKSMWYRFSISTIRAVRVTLAQPGTDIKAGDAGFTVYKANTCTPGLSNISNKLTPIGTFGNTFHPCVDSGVYYIQVSANSKAVGSLYIELEITDNTGALYDHPQDAYDFGVLNKPNDGVNYNMGCHSIEDASEICNTFPDAVKYNKSSWHTFTTPGYFDYITVLLTNSSQTYFTNAAYLKYLKFGYRLYKGDARTTAINALTPLGDCDSLFSNGSTAGYKMYKCGDLEINTTYSIQIFAHEDFPDDVRISLSLGGFAPSNGATPVYSAANDFGALTATDRATTFIKNDVLACNSRMNGCSNTIPVEGVTIDNTTYNLSTFFSFSLTTASRVRFSTYGNDCPPNLVTRVFRKKLTDNCADLSMDDLIGIFKQFEFADCLAPGDYVVQVLGIDQTPSDRAFDYYSTTSNKNCRSSNLGGEFPLRLEITRQVASSRFDLSSPGAIDSINKMQPLQNNGIYNAVRDTIGCANTVLPDTTCQPNATKAIYRQFTVADSGIVTFRGMQESIRYQLFSGDAQRLAMAQNAFSFPQTITGLTPVSECMTWNYYCNSTFNNVCLIPGTYTFVTFGEDRHLNRTDPPGLKFSTVESKFGKPAEAEDFGSILDSLPLSGGSIVVTTDTFTCRDNAVPINGYIPCNINGKPATKAIYRQFYLKEAAMVSIVNVSTSRYNCEDPTVMRTLFSGRASDGLNGLIPVGGRWNCFNSSQYKDCDLLQPGWYTIVSYGSGPSFDEPTKNLNEGGLYGSFVNKVDNYRIDITVCATPKYNRPYKASVNGSGQPHLLEWKEQENSSPAYPVTSNTYTLPTENFNCQDDTPFSSHPIKPCDSTVTKVAYWVFTTKEPLYMEISTGSLWAQIFPFDVRTDSVRMMTTQPIQPCVNGAKKIQLCELPAGTYTLVVFAGPSNVCSGVTPTIYVDRLPGSRFDHAVNAYDFAVVPPDNEWHYGKVGDINPLHPNRAPSNDFFSCTAGSQPTDPREAVCSQDTVYNMYDATKVYMYEGVQNSLNIVRRNLWYTFVVDKPGWVYVKVDSKTKGKTWLNNFAVYQSPVDGSLPFSTVVANGLVDSSIAQGLKYIVRSNTGNYCNAEPGGVKFYRDPCTQFMPQRYYILVEENNPMPNNPGMMMPNNQIEVAIRVDSVNLVLPKYDHYYQAFDFGNVGAGHHVGDTDNYSCATRDVTDPLNAYRTKDCSKTLWYKFTSTATGTVRFRINVEGAIKYESHEIQLFREIIPGDSTSNGLLYLPGTRVTGSDNKNWSQTCVEPGTYYLILPGCNQINEFVFPEIEILEQMGDFCGRAMAVTVNGAGSFTSNVLINCHTIGTDYGEFNPELSCPPGEKTEDYKTSWFRIDVTGTDTLDITTYIDENTTTTPDKIKYRMMTGDCGAMQEESCVMDARTRNTYKCLTAGSYYIQVFTPKYSNPIQKLGAITGDIQLNITAVKHVDTCAPVKECLVNANFQAQFDCTKDKAVRFVNYSTYGTSIKYHWDFGYGGQTSTEVSPSFVYPFMDKDTTYNVTLKAVNTGCNDSSIITIPVTVPARPYIDLGPDTLNCEGNRIELTATSWPGSTFRWNTGSTSNRITTTTGARIYWVDATYNGCTTRDSISVKVNPIVARTQTAVICNTDSVLLNARRSQNETHQWSTGETSYSIYAKEAGLYTDTISWEGCVVVDSFTVLKPGAAALGNDTTICFNQPYVLDVTTPGATYLWQNNSTASTFSVTAPGKYWVRIRIGSCTISDTVLISGTTTLFDSATVSLCSGQFYTLPGGMVVNTPGSYTDTLRSHNGCDSLIFTTKILVDSVVDSIMHANICAGQSFTLPWGTVVQTTGTYSHTYRAVGGCDSVRYTVRLSIASVLMRDTTVMLCSGNSYTLPSGRIISAAGVYQDTVRYAGGCDSLITTARVSSTIARDSTISQTICSNSSYTLPWGAVADTAGIYRHVIYNREGCDSIRIAVHLSIKQTTIQNISTAICAGDTYTLPSGKRVNIAGNYIDTLKYTTGCDSLITYLNLQILQVSDTTVHQSICSGGSYTLPWGTVVSAAGTYIHTYKATAGCDSLRFTVIITSALLSRQQINDSICTGENYRLPSGKIVSRPGIYSDTLRYTGGCDSIITTISLHQRQTTHLNLSSTICENQGYTLPSGKFVYQAGVYKDTLKYKAGCDSIIYTVSLHGQTVLYTTREVSFCGNQTYTMPSGQIVSREGTYHDTLRYKTGCDSLIHTIRVKYLKASTVHIRHDICEGGSFTLPSGTTVNSPGKYTEVIKSANGCDSIITSIILAVNKKPRLSLTKSNDITCSNPSAQLTATGAQRYEWFPSQSLSRGNTRTPIASPKETTMYTVRGYSEKNCMSQDSILVIVNGGDTEGAFLLANAFTPNNDGLNDCFGASHWGEVAKFHLLIYNRFGNVVFETRDIKQCWDGTYLGNPVDIGVYAYKVSAETICGPVYRKGTVAVIR